MLSPQQCHQQSPPRPRRTPALAGTRHPRGAPGRRGREDRREVQTDPNSAPTNKIQEKFGETCDTIVGIPPEDSFVYAGEEISAANGSVSVGEVISDEDNAVQSVIKRGVLVSRNSVSDSRKCCRGRCLRLEKCIESDCRGQDSWRRWICSRMEQWTSRTDGTEMGEKPKVARRRGSALATLLHMLLMILATAAVVKARSAAATRYETAYACEGKTLKIECRDGEVIHLIRANYGRFSITICNDHGNTDWSVNCMSTKSLRVLHTKCSMNQNCSILASTSMFGDPCPNTLKYLEAHYTCTPAATTSSTFRPSPPWLITSQPSVWRSTVPSTSLNGGGAGNAGSGSNGGSGGRPSSAAGGGGAHHLAPPTLRPHITMPPDLRPGVIKVKNDGHSPEMAGKPSPKVPPLEAVVPVVTGDVLVEPEPIDEVTDKPKEDGREGFTESSPKNGDDSFSGDRDRDRETAVASPPHDRERDKDREHGAAGEGDGGRRHHHHPHHDNTDTTAPVLPLWRHCPPTGARGLHWNWTTVGEVAVQPCPGGATGLARWRCVSTAHRLVHLQQQKRLGAPSRETMSGHSSRTPVLLDAMGAETLLTGRDIEQNQDMTDFRQDMDNLMLPDPLASSGHADTGNSLTVQKPFDGESQGKAVWISESPDLSECRSVWLNSLETRVKEGESLLSISNDLSQVTSSKTLYGGDMMTTTNIMKKLSTRMAQNIKTFPDSRQKEAIVTDLLLGAVKTGSNLLDTSQQASWKDLSHPAQMRVATSLLIGLEENAFLLAEAILREKTIVQQVKNILLSVRVLETRNVETEEFPSAIARQQWTASQDSIFLPRGALIDNSEGGLVRIVFVAFDRLEEILQPPSAPPQAEEVTLAPPASQGEGVEHPQINKDRDNVTRVINSKVISASLGKGRHIQLSQPVKLTLHHLRTENVTNPTCVFWDYTVNVWSAEGCRVEWTNATHTGCQCVHLTNFALLMDVRAVPLAPAHRLALHLITVVGCAISAVALVAAIIVFHCFRGMKSDRITIHKNLCACLLIAEVVFMFGIERTANRVMCGVIAALLHYFFLAAFAWMFLEGFQLYAMLVEVFEPERARARWYYPAAYVVPLIIVAISGAVDPASYGTDRHCWLRADNYFILGFVVPVAIVLLANWICLCMVVYMMCHHSNVSIKAKENNKLYKIKVWLRSSIFLAVLLGLTWTFGLLYLSEETVVFAYLFTAFNSFQGLFIFIFHCLLNESFQKECGRLGRRHRWLACCAHLAPAALPATPATTGGGSTSPPPSGSGQAAAGSGGAGPLGSAPPGKGRGARQHDDLRLDDTMDGHQSGHSSSVSASTTNNLVINNLNVVVNNNNHNNNHVINNAAVASLAAAAAAHSYHQHRNRRNSSQYNNSPGEPSAAGSAAYFNSPNSGSERSGSGVSAPMSHLRNPLNTGSSRLPPGYRHNLQQGVLVSVLTGLSPLQRYTLRHQEKLHQLHQQQQQCDRLQQQLESPRSWGTARPTAPPYLAPTSDCPTPHSLSMPSINNQSLNSQMINSHSNSSNQTQNNRVGTPVPVEFQMDYNDCNNSHHSRSRSPSCFSVKMSVTQTEQGWGVVQNPLSSTAAMTGTWKSTSSKHQPQVMMTQAGTLQHSEHPRRGDPNRTRERHHNTDSLRLAHNAHPRQHHYHPHSHTYSEVGRGGYRRGSEQEFREIHDDPVYEEIERNETLMSDVSDDNSGHGDGFVRPVDQLGHQTKFYGDHRPLISYSPGDRHRYDRSPVALDHQVPHGKYNTGRWGDSLERHADRTMYAYHPQDPSNMRHLAAVLKADNDVTSKVLCPGHGHGTHQRVLPPYSDC